MMLFNTVSFGVVLGYSVSDRLSNSYLLSFQQRGRGSLFKLSALLRWWITGALYGFLFTFTILVAYPDVDEEKFGATVLSMQCAALTARCWFVSNTLGRSITEPIDDSIQLEWKERLAYWSLRMLHSRIGFSLPCLCFIRIATLWSNIEVIPVVILSIFAALITVALDCLIFPRWGLLASFTRFCSLVIQRLLQASISHDVLSTMPLEHDASLDSKKQL